MAYVERKRWDPFTAMEIGNQKTCNHEHYEEWNYEGYNDNDGTDNSYDDQQRPASKI